MPENSHTHLTSGLWFFSTLILIALFISAAAQGELTAGHVVLAALILGIGVLASPFLLRLDGHMTVQEGQEKLKRQPIDNLLENLSDTELRALMRRLADVDENDKETAHLVGDDGELVWRQ